ncbi:myosin-10-like [Lampris incognitus]|uniref:myosin-10-like n=1 Tax=Lampris incognitus TaxID=2546036 RepID=UPI0024B4E692|nr:myosin-10-like [Lampris incognitus]
MYMELVDFLQQRVSLVAEESLRDATHLGTHLEQVSSELQCLQSSEVQLESLVEELHAEARHRATLIESLQAELHSKTVELEEQQNSNKTQAEELRELHDAYQRKVRELQQQDQGSLRKLQDTAEQFECLCHQQRHWMCCVKRFKDSLTEEKKALVQQVSTLEKRVAELRMSSRGSCPTKVRDTDRERFDRILPLWDTDAIAGLQSKMDKLGGQYEELFGQLMSVDKARRAVDGYQKPP